MGLFFGGPFGSFPLYLSVLALLGFAALAPKLLLTQVLTSWELFIFPTLCVVSSFWSDAPFTTLDHSVELWLTFVMAVAICKTLSPKTVVLTTLICSFILIMCCMPFVPETARRNGALAGIFGSKNAMGFTSHMALCAGLCTLLLPGRGVRIRLIALATVAGAAVTLYLSRSAGANVDALISLTVICICLGYRSLPRRMRPLVVATLAIAAPLVILAFPTLKDAWDHFQLEVLHKDTSLTGRTYLWGFADTLIRERPWLGHGTFAFWRQGNLDAEGLWQRFFIASRTGFNFHNMFIETMVNNGYVGLALLVFLLVVVGATSVVGFLRRPSLETIFFPSYLAALYAGLTTESGLMGPFDLFTFFWIAAYFYGRGRGRRRRRRRSGSRRLEAASATYARLTGRTAAPALAPPR